MGGEPWLHQVPLFGGLRPWRFYPWSLAHVQGLASACPSLHLESMFARATRVVQEGPHSMLACDLKWSALPLHPARISRSGSGGGLQTSPHPTPSRVRTTGLRWSGFESPVLLHTNGDSPGPAGHWASDVQEAELAIGPRTSPVGVPKLAGNQPSDASGIGSSGTGTPPQEFVSPTWLRQPSGDVINLVATTL